jgi:hypothetical protein
MRRRHGVTKRPSVGTAEVSSRLAFEHSCRRRTCSRRNRTFPLGRHHPIFASVSPGCALRAIGSGVQLPGRSRARGGTMSERGKWLAAGMAMLALLSGNMALAQAKRTDDRVLMKPDLRIVSFVAERTGLNADGSHRVRLSVNVRCAGSFPGSCGAFKIRVERSDSATGPRTFLGEGGVASLATARRATTLPGSTRAALSTRQTRTTTRRKQPTRPPGAPAST